MQRFCLNYFYFLFLVLCPQSAKALFFIPPDLQQQADIHWVISIDPDLDDHLSSSAYDAQLAYKAEKSYMPPNMTWVTDFGATRLEEFIANKIVNVGGLNGISRLCKLRKQTVCTETDFLQGQSGSLRARPELGGAHSRDERVNFINWYQYHSSLEKRFGYLLYSAYSKSVKPDQWFLYSYKNNKVELLKKPADFQSLLSMLNIINGSGLGTMLDKTDSITSSLNKRCSRFIHLHLSEKPKKDKRKLKASNGALLWMNSLGANALPIPLQPFIREYSNLSKQLLSSENDYESAAHIQAINLSLVTSSDGDSYSVFDDELLQYQKAIQNTPYYLGGLYKKIAYLKNYGSIERFLVSEYDARINISQLYEFSGCNTGDCQPEKLIENRAPVYSAYQDEKSKRWINFNIRQKDNAFIQQWLKKYIEKPPSLNTGLKSILLNLSGGVNNSQPVYIVGDNAVFFVTADNAGYISLYQTDMAVNLNKHELTVLVNSKAGQTMPSRLIWRFIPPASLNSIVTKQALNHELSPALDGPITYQRIQNAGKMKDILLVAHGRGGAAYTALDLTEVLAGKSNKAKMLWQLTTETVSELGYSLNNALFFQSNIKSKKSLSSWHLAIANGYKIRSKDQCDLLYIIDPLTGQLQKVFKSPVCEKGLSQKKNNNSVSSVISGLSGLAVLDINKDGKTDYIYAADHAASLRRFDLTASKISQWKISLYGEKDYLFQALDSKGTPKNVQAAPAVAIQYGHQGDESTALIAMATGRYLEKQDFYIQGHSRKNSQVAHQTKNQAESLYVLSEQFNCKKSCRESGIKKADLYQVKTVNAANRFSWKRYQGWYFNLPEQYEGAIYQPLIINGILLLQTFVLEAKACVKQDMSSYLYAFDLNLNTIKPFFQPPSELSFDIIKNNNPIRVLNTARQPMQILKCPYGLCVGLGVKTIGFDDGFIQGRRRWQLLY